MLFKVRNSVDKKIYNSIDLTKFICAILIITIHISPFGSNGENSIISYLNFGIQDYIARIAVPFFFMASGFFLYRKTLLADFDPELSKKYCIRIFQLYIIWTIIYSPLIIGRFFNDKQGLVHAILVFVRDTIFTGSYTQLWYLNGLIVAVIITSVLLYKKVSLKKILLCAIILYLIGLFAQSWFGFIEPLKELTPTLWSILELIEKVIVTTRDGVFLGFPFVSLGMCFAFFDIKISKKKSFVGLCISMVLLLFEVFLFQYIGFVHEHNMYLFLVPVTFFLFAFVKEVQLADNAIYKTLRTLSSLIFFGHLWVGAVVGKLLSFISEGLGDSWLKFVISLIVTIIWAYIVMKLSERKKFKLLSYLY